MCSSAQYILVGGLDGWVGCWMVGLGCWKVGYMKYCKWGVDEINKKMSGVSVN